MSAKRNAKPRGARTIGAELAGRATDSRRARLSTDSSAYAGGRKSMAARSDIKPQGKQPLTLGEIVDAHHILNLMSEGGVRMGEGNAVRLLIGAPERLGIIDGAQVDAQELNALLAKMFAEFFEIHGAQLPAGLRMVKAQRRGSQAGAKKAKERGAAVADEIRKAAAIVKAKGGIRARDIAGVVARKVNKTPKHVRAVLKKAEKA
jgi:hypothetical protein